MKTLLILLTITAAWGQVPSYTISTIAGDGVAGYSGDGGPATSAKMNVTRGIVTDPDGNVYIVDQSNNVIREVTTNGIINTVVGTGVAGYNGTNIQGTRAQLYFPYRLAMDPPGNLYIADTGNMLIRKLSPGGILTNVAGTPGVCAYTGDGGAAINAGLCEPFDAVVDALGNMYIADTLNNVVRKVGTNGIITTVAGNGKGAGQNPGNYNGPGSGTGGYSGDGGPATKAALNYPVSVAVDAAGNLYIADQFNNVVRKVDANGIITTFAGSYGNGGIGYSGDGGQASNAAFVLPAGIAVDTAGDVYIADSNNYVIREVLTNGVIWTIAGNGKDGYSGDGGASTSAELNYPRSVAVGTFGDIYVADTSNNVVRELTPGAPTVGHVTNAFGNSAVIAENSWIALKGANLAKTMRMWTTSDFVNGQMPASLDGVSVTFTGPNGYQGKAYIYYVSPSQLNILTPPDLPSGVVQVQVNNNGTTSSPGLVAAQQTSLSFFAFDGTHVVAQHLDYTDVGPTTLYPGLTTPAKAGEEVVLYANGFGATTAQITPGAAAQSGTLPTMPVVMIGGVQAQVLYAGLAGVGEFQFNVVIPQGTPSGDISLTATYGGQSTQSGVVITVQN